MEDENALVAAEAATENSEVTEANTETTENQDAGSGGEETETTQRPSRARDRIQQLNADKRAAIEFAELQRQRAEEAEKKLNASNGPSDDSKQPVLSDFKTPEEWASATQSWATDQAARKATEVVEQRLRDAENTRSQNSRRQSFTQKEADASANYEDYYEVTRDPGAMITPEMLEVISGLDAGPDVAYYLASHAPEAAQIAALPPMQMAAAIGRVEGKAKPPQKATQPDVTQAPPPPTPVGGGSAAEVDLTKLTTADYIAKRREQRKAAGKR